MNYCVQKYTTHQFTYFIYYLFQDKFKNPKNCVLCAKMMISLRLELQNLSMRTLGNVLGCTQGLRGMGLIVATIQ